MTDFKTMPTSSRREEILNLPCSKLHRVCSRLQRTTSTFAFHIKVNRIDDSYPEDKFLAASKTISDEMSITKKGILSEF